MVGEPALDSPTPVPWKRAYQPQGTAIAMEYIIGLALLNLGMNCTIYPHPSPLPKGEGTRVLAPFIPREKGWG
jgi:hypothetical protein